MSNVKGVKGDVPVTKFAVVIKDGNISAQQHLKSKENGGVCLTAQKNQKKVLTTTIYTNNA